MDLLRHCPKNVTKLGRRTKRIKRAMRRTIVMEDMYCTNKQM